MKASYEFASKKLDVIRNLLWKYGRLLDPAEAEDMRKLSVEQSEKLTLDPYVDVDLVVRLYQRVTYQVTIARVNEIRLKVEKQSSYWVTKYGEQFTKTEADKRAQNWLFGASSGQYKVVKAWIEEGWNLLRGDLSAPWGRCKECKIPVRPKKVNDREVVFELCDRCYLAEKNANNERLEATKGGHKVAKPGSAAKHGHGHAINPNIRPMDRKKGKK